MNQLDILQRYRWSVREREALLTQLERLDAWEPRGSQGSWQRHRAREERRETCRRALTDREERLAEDAERFEAILAGVAHPRTRLVLRQYYALGMTDEEIAEADGFSARLAGSIRNGWLRQQGIEPRRRVRGGGGEGSR